MAGALLSTVSAVMSVLYADQLADQIRRDVLLPNLLEVANDRNSACNWRVKFSGRDTAAAKAEGHEVDRSADFSTHIRKQATLAWAEYFAYARVSGLGEATQQASEGQSLFAEELVDAVDELAVLISSDTYVGQVGASPAELEGLTDAVDSTGTYAGLAQATYGEWASGEQTLPAASLSLDNLRTKLHRTFKDACGMWPEFVVCPGAQWDAVCALYNDQTRQMVDVVTTQARGQVNLKAAGGFRAVMVDGIPYIEDRHCTASTFYALHSSALSYRQVPALPVGMDIHDLGKAIKDLVGVTLEPGEIEQMLVRGGQRLQPYIKLLGADGDNTDAMVKWYGQLRLKYRNRAAKLTLT